MAELHCAPASNGPNRGAFFALFVFAAVAISSVVACSRTGTTARHSPNERVIRDVSGRTELGVGLSLNFPAGWVEEESGGRPFSKYYENFDQQLAIGCAQFSSNGQAVTTLGDQIKRRLGASGQVLESGPVTIGSTPGYKVVATQKTPSGHGIVTGIVVLRDTGIASTLYLYSAGDEKRDHRPEMDALLATLLVN